MLFWPFLAGLFQGMVTCNHGLIVLPAKIVSMETKMHFPIINIG